MAEVFEAEALGELGFVRKVAIKRMLVDAASDEMAARRFLDEARIASRLHHGGIVAVTDVGLLDGLPFHVLELVDGINASQLQQRAGGTLPLEIALVICADVAHALDHAHHATDASGSALGVVHRDVKPSNILISWTGDVKLADFGIAIAHERSARTESGLVAGTLGFIAPEQRTRGEVDGRADVFALGLTLCAMLTGETPLRDIAVEIELLAGTAVPLPPSIPHDVSAVIARALAPARVDRPPAARFAAELGGLLVPRITRDPRSVLRSFLETHHGEKRSSRGALDHLLGIEVVATPATDSGPPEFRTVAARDRAHAPTVSAPATADVKEPPTTLRRAPERVRPGRRWGLVATACVLTIGVAFAVTRVATSSGPAPLQVPDAALITAIAPDASPREAAAAPLDAVVTTGAIDATAPPDATDLVRRRTAGTRPRAIVDAALASSEVGTGWLQVVGESLVGAEVSVDSKYTASVPNALEVPLGRHRVAVTLRDGSSLPAKLVDVTSFHTVRRPLKLTW